MGIVDYRPGDSFMHKLDPRVKIIVLFVFSVIVFICENIFAVSAMCITFVIMWCICKLPWSDLKSMMKIVAVTMTLVIVLQTIFYGSADTSHFIVRVPEHVKLIGGMGLKWEGLFFGILLSIRFYALIILLPMVVKTTRLDQMSLALVRLHLPYKFAYMTTTALNTIPTFSEELHTVQDAQKMRGQTVFEDGKLLEKVKGWVSLVIPMVVGAMRRAQQMGVAMDARAFGAYPTRTYISTIEMKKSDWIIMITLFAMGVVFLVLNYTLPNPF